MGFEGGKMAAGLARFYPIAPHRNAAQLRGGGQYHGDDARLAA
jgi:hypothetical protein